MRGTLLNTFTVVLGSLIGLGLGNTLPAQWQETVQTGIGLVVICVGVSMFLKSKNFLVVVGAIAVGGILGAWWGIDVGLNNLSEWFRVVVKGQGEFNKGFVTASVLYCVGPMTLLGCMQDAIEKKIELLGLKSMLDGTVSIFLAAGSGVGVLASAATVLVFQGLLTLLARFLKPIAEHPEAMDEATATGGAIMVAIGFGLTGIKDIAAELFLPSLFLAPTAVLVGKAWTTRRKKESPAAD